MSEHATSADKEDISALKAAYSSYSELAFTEIQAGSMNNVYSVSDGTIVHTTPAQIETYAPNPDIVTPHASLNKGTALGRVLMKMTVSEDESILIPNVYKFGEYQSETIPYSFWAESTIPGIALKDTTNGISIQEYSKTLEWLVQLQQFNTCNEESLKDYYLQRLEGYRNFFLDDQNTEITKGFLPVLDSYAKAIEIAVHALEKTSFIHGDLNPSNILIDSKDRDNLTIGIIDFEKSIYNGDPAADAAKLLLLKHDYITPDENYSYVPPQLNSTDKTDLLEFFYSLRYKDDIIIAQSLINSRYQRDYLIHLDTSLSVLAYRILNKHGKTDNSSFIAKYILDLYNKTMKSGVVNEQ